MKLVKALLSPPNDYARQKIDTLPAEVVRDQLLRALLAAQLAQRAILPSERIPSNPSLLSTRSFTGITLSGLAEWLSRSIREPLKDSNTLYGPLLVYAITLWRIWRRENLPCSPGFTLLAARALFAPQTLSITKGRSLRVKLSPAGLRPLRERWESAPARAYREPITHAEVLDGLSLVVEDELVSLKWRHLAPWPEADKRGEQKAVRPLSARAAVERRAPRLWLFPLEAVKPDLVLKEPDEYRPWTGGFVMKHTTSRADELKGIVLWIKQVTAEEPDLSRDVLVFPELSLGEADVGVLRQALDEAGLKPAMVIAGSHHTAQPPNGQVSPDGLVFAQAPIYGDGEVAPLWRHQKRGPFRVTKEQWRGVNSQEANKLPDDAELWERIVPGDEFITYDGPGGRIGVLICADLLEERFPSMRDLVRIACVDLLIVVNYSPTTTPFLRHAEQLNRLGVCAVFLNATTAVVAGVKSEDKCTLKCDAPQPIIEPFSALVSLPQLNVPSSTEPKTSKVPTAIVWRCTDDKLVRRVKSGWIPLTAEANQNKIKEFKAKPPTSPAALVVDLNAWLPEPAPIHPVIQPLEAQITAALKELPSRYAERISALRAAERAALPALARSIPADAKTLLQRIYAQGLFEPTKEDQGQALGVLMNQRLARPHRLAAPPPANQSSDGATPAPKEDTDAQHGIAESSFLVSLTPLGDALGSWLNDPANTPSIRAPAPLTERRSLRPTGRR